MATETKKDPVPVHPEPAAPEVRSEVSPPPPSAGVNRIFKHANTLASDFREWIDLRIELLKMELAEEAARKAGNGAILAILGLFGLAFLLISIAIGIGELLNHIGWGFLIVTLLLFLAAGIIAKVKPRLYRAKVSKRKFNGQASLPEPQINNPSAVEQTPEKS